MLQKLCNDKGSCVCGQCSCTAEDGYYKGPTCEDCPVISCFFPYVAFMQYVLTTHSFDVDVDGEETSNRCLIYVRVTSATRLRPCDIVRLLRDFRKSHGCTEVAWSQSRRSCNHAVHQWTLGFTPQTGVSWVSDVQSYSLGAVGSLGALP